MQHVYFLEYVLFIRQSDDDPMGSKHELSAIFYKVVFDGSVTSGSLSHGTAHPKVADGETASNMESSCEYIE
jgi:hypothetical protein